MAFTGMVTTFRTLGAAGATAVPQCLFTLENLTGSGVTVVIRRIVVQMDGTAVQTTNMAQLKVCRFTPPVTGGITLTAIPFDSSQTQNTFVQCKGWTSSDGGTATTLTVTAGTYHWQSYGTRLHTLLGQVIADDADVLPADISDSNYSLRLYAGQGIAVQVFVGITASNPATNHYIVNCVWEEI